MEMFSFHEQSQSRERGRAAHHKLALASGVKLLLSAETDVVKQDYAGDNEDAGMASGRLPKRGRPLALTCIQISS